MERQTVKLSKLVEIAHKDGVFSDNEIIIVSYHRYYNIPLSILSNHTIEVDNDFKLSSVSSSFIIFYNPGDIIPLNNKIA